jgi:hypothetical protein
MNQSALGLLFFIVSPSGQAGQRLLRSNAGRCSLLVCPATPQQACCCHAHVPQPPALCSMAGRCVMASSLRLATSTAPMQPESTSPFNSNTPRLPHSLALLHRITHPLFAPPLTWHGSASGSSPSLALSAHTCATCALLTRGQPAAGTCAPRLNSLRTDRSRTCTGRSSTGTHRAHRTIDTAALLLASQVPHSHHRTCITTTCHALAAYAVASATGSSALLQVHAPLNYSIQALGTSTSAR